MSLLDKASLVQIPSGYKDGKLYSVVPDSGAGDLDFARSSTGTRVNESGLIETIAIDTPRIDYTAGGCGKLLLEPQRTNTVLYNSDYTQYWTLANVIPTANATISPNGNNEAQKLTSANTFGQHYIRQIIGGHTVGAPHVYSCFAKAAEIDIISLRLINGGGPTYVNFDLTNGTHDGGANGKMIDFGNGWYRCMTYHPSSTSQYLYPYIYTQVGDQQGDGVSGFYVYGAMIEEGTYETSLINTSGATVTRVADTCVTTGLSNVIGQTEGTMFFEIDFANISGVIGAWAISDGSKGNRITMNTIGFSSTQYTLSIAQNYNSGSTKLASANVTFADKHKVAIKYFGTTLKLFVDGQLSDSVTTDGFGNYTNFIVGGNQVGTGGDTREFLQAHLYNTALTDAELITLTTL